MKINSSTLGMDASTVYREVNTVKGLLATKENALEPTESFRFDRIDSGTGFTRTAAGQERSGSQAVSIVKTAENTTEHSWSKELVVSRMVSEVIGQQANIREITIDNPVPAGTAGAENENDSRRRIVSSATGMQVTLGLQNVQYHQEGIRVSTSGTLTTADGREISLQLELSLESEEVVHESSYVNMLSSRFIDPLVLSFEDGLSVLGDSRFSFDLDCDGEAEEINSLKSGSGFLVLDKNSDGTINDGHELFGPDSGYGYQELSIYDVDGNQWIDENDPVFDQLQLWMAGGSDLGKLVSLREAGVGALSLASTDAHFNLKDGTGRIVGQIAQSGLFVTEDGEVRPLTEVKLGGAVEPQPETLSGLSMELKLAIVELREMIARHRKRVANLAAMQLREEKVEKQRDRLIERLLELREDHPDIIG